MSLSDTSIFAGCELSERSS